MPYLTPGRYREMGFGIDLSTYDDAELASFIAMSDAVVDSYCNVPRLPQKHSFLGGTITGEKHPWRMPYGPMDLGQRRMYLFHRPLRAVNQFRILVTNTQYVQIAPTELMVNEIDNYFEIVSLAVTSVGLFNALIIPNVGLATPIGLTDYDYGWDFEIVDESLTCSDGQTWRAQNQFWFTDPDRAPEIRKNGLVVTTGFTLDPVEGTVVFDDNLLATDTVTASYHHRLPTDIQMGDGQVVTHLIGQAQIQARGMTHLSRLKVAEVDMERRMPVGNSTGSLAQDLDSIVPEAALLLGSYREDNMTVR